MHESLRVRKASFGSCGVDTVASAGLPGQEVLCQALGPNSPHVTGIENNSIELSALGNCKRRMPQSESPRVLILSINRVNGSDASGNSLLLKNLFAEWPKE